MSQEGTNTDGEREARTLSAHLPDGYDASFDSSSDGGGGGGKVQKTVRGLLRNLSSDQGSSLKLQGGDVHRDLFKAEQRAKQLRRSQTFSHPQVRDARFADAEPDIMSVEEQQMPGGFRRQYMQSRPSFLAARTPITRNFVQFLDLYGSFAGEDLAESDEDNDDDNNDAVEDSEDDTGVQRHQDERRPLLGERKSSRRPKQGEASTLNTFFTLIKAFIGTGIMFLPKAFNNGGLVFSSVTLILISALSMLAFHLLLRCRTACGGGGYGDIGQAIAGAKMRALILGSITLSQLGFVCAGMVFVAQNLYTFASAMVSRRTGDSTDTPPISTTSLIALQLAVIVPLAFIRNISKLGPVAMLADVFIFLGVFYIYWYDISYLLNDGLNSTVVFFNPDYFTLTVGSCIFTFEGIGLILPIQSSMAKPQRFEWLLAVVMALITIIFCSVGALCYATFGDQTKIEVIDNYPQTSALVNAVQFLYAVAVLAGTPVQLFPAIRIIENKLFARSKSGKKDASTKWKKNAFRTALAGLCAGVAIAGASNLDRFVALIGSFACVPLVYIYPAFLHYQGVAQNKWVKAADVAFMVLGAVGMVYTTAITIKSSFL